jgi:hypothetical protein
MITRDQVMPLLLEACSSFHSFWGEDHRASGSEDHVLYVAFGAFAEHLRSLQRRDQTSEFPAVGSAISRLRNEGDAEVRKLAEGLRECIGPVLSA